MMKIDTTKATEKTTINHDAKHLLDALIQDRHQLGELGKQLQILLRQAGVKATIDPKASDQLH